ncbi:diaphanous-like protein 3, partial [Oryzias melastigma]
MKNQAHISQWRRVSVADEKHNKHTRRNWQTKNDETGVMDCLLEALQSGAAFRDRRKRAPRPR